MAMTTHRRKINKQNKAKMANMPAPPTALKLLFEFGLPFPPSMAYTLGEDIIWPLFPQLLITG